MSQLSLRTVGAPGLTQVQSGRTVDAALGTVEHRAEAQPGLLLLVPALLAELGKEGCDLPAG